MIVFSKHVLKNGFLNYSYQNYFLSKTFLFATFGYFTYLPFSYQLAYDIYEPLINKYEDQAISRGFNDYQISEDRFAGTFLDRFILDKIITEPKN